MLDFGPGSFFLTPSQILDSPSFRDGVHSDAEKSLRFYGCEIIQEAGILLRLPQVVAATAQVLFHRFFYKKSMFCHDVRAVAASSFWLAMKLEEEKGASNRGGKPSKLNDVVSMFEHIRARREGVQPLPPHSPAFKLLKDEVLKLEMRMLIEFGFVCNVEHPHKLLLGILNSLEASKELIQESWNLVNDSLRTTLCVCYPSNVIACGIVFAAARRLSVPLPENPPWWDLFDVSNEQIHSVCLSLADLYRQPKPHYIDVKTLSSQSIDVGSFTEASAGDSVKSSLSPVREISPNCDKPTSSECNDTIPAIDLKSQSEVLNSSFVNGSGSPQLKDAVKDVLKDRDQTSLCSRNSRKRVWDSSFDSVRKGCREFDSSSCHEQKRTARQSHSRSRSRSGRDNHREREHALRHYEHHRCSSFGLLKVKVFMRDPIPMVFSGQSGSRLFKLSNGDKIGGKSLSVLIDWFNEICLSYFTLQMFPMFRGYVLGLKLLVCMNITSLKLMVLQKHGQGFKGSQKYFRNLSSFLESDEVPCCLFMIGLSFVKWLVFYVLVQISGFCFDDEVYREKRFCLKGMLIRVCSVSQLRSLKGICV